MFIKTLNESAFLGGDTLDHVAPTRNGYEGEAGMYQILHESSEEWGSLTMAMANIEVTAHLEGDEMLLLEGVREFASSAKEFFMKIWKKIQELFNQFTTWLQASLSTDAQFVSKYKDKVGSLTAKLPSDWKYKMIKGLTYTSVTNTLDKGIAKAKTETNAIVSKMTASGAEIAEYGKGYKYDKEKYTSVEEQVREAFCGSSDKASFRKEFIDVCCGGDSSAEELDKGDIKFDVLMANVKDGKKLINDMKKAKDSMGQQFSTIIKGLENLDKKVSKIGGNKAKDTKISTSKFEDGEYSSKEYKKSKLDRTGSFEYSSAGTSPESEVYGVSNISRDAGLAITSLKEISRTCQEAFGIAISLVKKAKAQSRGCLTSALRVTANGVVVRNESGSLLAQFGYDY